ncbi:MAG: DUF5668 domain-containing protein [Candidatus Symbiothrix sp.]|jgi:predicted membrane protein|nr:DUF5668 domain-containing protein [Candidatus Symbiothrix sp.]
MRKKVVIGIIIMFLGLFLLFNNLEIIDRYYYSWVISWPTLLIAIGAVLLSDRKRDNQSAGIVLIVIGAIFLIPRIINTSLNGILFPALIIGLGVLFIVRATTKKKDTIIFGKDAQHHFNDTTGTEHHPGEDFKEKPFTENVVDEDGFIKREYVFTASKERWSYGKIKRVEIEAIFSGIELDFTQAELSDNVKTVYISITSVFSGVILYVPSDWNISVRKTGVFGGFSDNRPRYLNSAGTGEKMVILELESVFGGGEIKSYE